MKTTEILTYKRTGNGKPQVGSGVEVMLIIMGLLAGRVELWGMVMPTGISWAIANFKDEKRERLPAAIIASAAGIVLGGMDVFRIRGLVTLAVIYFMSKTDISFFKKNTLFTSVFGALVNLICGGIILGVTSGDSAGYIMLIIEAFLIVGAAVAFDNFVGIVSRGGSILTDDEGISVFVAAGVAAAGLSGIELWEVRLSAVVGMYMIIFASKKCGLGISVTLATVLGIATGGDDPVSALGMYIFLAIGCSLLGSMGKWGLVLGATLANAVFVACRMGMDNSIIRVVELTIATAGYYFTPEKFINSIAKYTTKKQPEGMDESRAKRQKLEAENTISEIEGAVTAVAEIVREMSEDCTKTEPEQDIIKKVNNTVCSGCALKKYCSEKNRVQTEQAIGYMLQLFKEKGDIDTVEKILFQKGEKNVLEKAFSWSCIHTERVVEKVHDSFEFYLRQELENKKIAGYREFAINGIEDMAEIIGRQRKRLSEECNSYEDTAGEISEALIRNGIETYGVCVIKNRTGLFEVAAAVNGEFLGETEKIIKGIMELEMKTVSEEKTEKGVVLCMREKEHFEYEAAVLSLDNKERRTGDTASYFDDGKGFLHCMISDGMGSGVLAAKESGWTVKLYEKLCRAGFEPSEALRMINNVMIAGKPGESCISADSVKVNLLNGMVEFAKAGAASSYIKTKKGAEKIGWSSLPLGILEISGIETRFCDLSDGGYVVLMSDGVPDSAGDRMEGEHSLRKALEECDEKEPREMAEYLMFASMAMGVPKDDMTVLVVKLSKK